MRGWTVSEKESSSEPITVGNRYPFEPSYTGTLIIDVQ